MFFSSKPSFVLVNMYVVVVECELAGKQKATCTCMLPPNASRLILHYVFWSPHSCFVGDFRAAYDPAQQVSSCGIDGTFCDFDFRFKLNNGCWNSVHDL